MKGHLCCNSDCWICQTYDPPQLSDVN